MMTTFHVAARSVAKGVTAQASNGTSPFVLIRAVRVKTRRDVSLTGSVATLPGRQEAIFQALLSKPGNRDVLWGIGRGRLCHATGAASKIYWVTDLIRDGEVPKTELVLTR